MFDRVTMDRAKLMRSVSNDHIPVRHGNAIQESYPNFRHAKKVNRYFDFYSRPLSQFPLLQAKS